MIEVHEPISPERAWTLTQHQAPGALPPRLPESAKRGMIGKVRNRLNQAHAIQVPAATLSELNEIEESHH